MAVVSVPKALNRVKKSLECFGQSTDCLCDLLEWCDVVGGSKADCQIVP